MSDKYLVKLVITVTFLIVILSGDLQAANLPSHKNPTKPTTLATGTSAPSFDISTIGNRQISLEDFKGKVTLIIFWATWCGPCKPVIKEVSSLYNQYHLQGFDVIAFSLDKNPEIVRDFLTKQQFPWRHNVWLKGETKNKIARSYGVRALPTVYLLGRDGRIRANNFVWAERGKEINKENIVRGKVPKLADAVKSLLTPKVSNNLHQYSSCVGGTVAINGVPVEDFSSDLTQMQGKNPGMWGTPVQSNEGNYLFKNIPPGQWLLDISLGAMHGVNGKISLLKEIEVLENIQWHNFWLLDDTCHVKCPINDSYVMFIKKWNEKRKEWLVYSQHRQILSKDKKFLNRSNYNFTNLPTGMYEYRLCSQIGGNVYIRGGKVEVKSGKTLVIAVENPERNFKIYGKITNFRTNLARPVVFVRKAETGPIKLSSFYEMGIWDAVAVVRGQGMKSDGKYECIHLPSGKYMVTAAQFKDSYSGIPVIQQSKPVSIDSENPIVLINFDLGPQTK